MSRFRPESGVADAERSRIALKVEHVGRAHEFHIGILYHYLTDVRLLCIVEQRCRERTDLHVLYSHDVNALVAGVHRSVLVESRLAAAFYLHERFCESAGVDCGRSRGIAENLDRSR